MQTRRRDWLAAIALAMLFAFTGLGNHPLRASDEPRVAGIGWEAQHTGAWLVPHLGGETFLEHPPLFYAALGACIRLLGATDAVARLPGAIASFATLLLVFSLGRRLADRAAGFGALLALVGSAGFFRYSHRAMVDPVLMLFVTLGIYAYVRAAWPFPAARDARGDVSQRWLLVVYLAAALAFWVKGFVGIACVGGPIAVDVLVARRWRALLAPAHLVGAPLLVAACAAWPLLLYRQEGDAALQEFMLANGLYRVLPSAAEGAYHGGHEHSFWYYFPRIPQQLGAMLAFVPALGLWLRRGRVPAGWNLPALRFLAWVFPIGTLLLSFPGTKRSLYLLPFEPSLAVALGAWLSAVRHDDPLRSRVEAGTAAFCAWVASGFGLRSRGEGRAAFRVSGPCDAPLQLVAVGFVVAVACQVAIYPFMGSDRDLEPLAREVDARVGRKPFVGFQLEESVRGALAFYTGRFAIPVRDDEDLAPNVEQSGADYLLAPDFMQQRIEADLGHTVKLQEMLPSSEGRHYGLYAVRATPVPAAGLARPSPDG
jgi:4-amino-4-deoxy-L-arabinose transferase-like glycosyltransferase